MKRGQLAIVISLVLLVAIVAVIGLLSEKKLSMPKAQPGQAIHLPPQRYAEGGGESTPKPKSCPPGTEWDNAAKKCKTIPLEHNRQYEDLNKLYGLNKDYVQEEIDKETNKKR
jgi:hypothetical protein